MTRHQLTGGSLLKIWQGAKDIGQPVLQLLQSERIAESFTPKYRVLISDGVNSSHGMLANPLNGYINENKLQQLCIFVVKDFQVCNYVQEKRTIKGIMILDLEILQAGTEVGSIIGNANDILYRNLIVDDETVPLQPIQPTRHSGQNKALNNNISNNKRFTKNQAAGAPPTKKRNSKEQPSGRRSEMADNQAVDLDDSIKEIDYKAEFKDQLETYDSKSYDGTENINAARENLIKWVEGILEEKDKTISNLTIKVQNARLLQSKYKPLEGSVSNHKSGEGSSINSLNSKKAMVESEPDNVNRLEKEVKQMKEKITATGKESISLKSQLQSSQLVLQRQVEEASSAKAQAVRLNDQLKFQEDKIKSLTLEITSLRNCMTNPKPVDPISQEPNIVKGQHQRINSIENKLMKQLSLLEELDLELNQINQLGNYISSKINHLKEMRREDSNCTVKKSYGNLSMNSISSAMEEIINPAALKMEELKARIQKSLQLIKDNLS